MAVRGRDRDGGFTLAELMVVVLVVAILIGVAVPTFLSARRRAQDTAAQANVAVAARAAASLLASTGTVDATSLAGEVGDLAIVGGSTVSTGARTVSLSSTVYGVTLTALSPSGTCVWSRIDANRQVTNGSSTGTCSAEQQASALVTNGLVVSLDAQALTSLAQDAAGTQPVTTAGQRVCSWGDRSGRGNNAVQATTGMCPVYGTDATGGFLDFDANGFLTVTPTLPVDITVLVVAQSDTTTWNDFGWLLSARGTNGFIVHPMGSTRTVGFYVRSAGGSIPEVGALSVENVTTPNLYSLTISGTGSTTGRFGANGASLPYWVTATRSTGALAIALGMDVYTGSTRYGNGKYREVAIYDRALSGAELAQMENYLRQKWGTP